MLTFVVIVCTGENEGRTGENEGGTRENEGRTGENEGRTGERTSGTDGTLNRLEYKVTVVHTTIYL